MRVLVDTCTLLWWLSDPAKLSPRAREILEDEGNDVLVSAVTGWEIATKHRRGNLPQAEMIVANFEEIVAEEGFTALLPTLKAGVLAGSMPGAHADPFDRFLAAQAILAGIPLITPDASIDVFPVIRVW